MERPKVFVLDSTGKLDNTFSTSSTNLYTQYPNYTVAAFAALSGYTLDTENSLTVSDTFTGNLPVYRLTGMELSVNVDFSNFRAINEYDPFNFDDHATMTVRLINGGDFVSPEYKNVDFNAVTLEAATAGATYEFRGVYLDFQSSGLMGVFDWYTMIVAIIACFVLIGIATSVMDVLGAFVYDSFKNDKYEDDGERQHIEHMILNMETNGVPFRHDDFQVMPNVSIRDFLKVLQRDIVKLSTLAHHMSRDLSAAGLNRHTMEIAQIDASAVKAARFVCVLIGPDRSELFLTGGPQTLGRGHGGMHSKKISHKQLSVIANTHTGAALVRGLPTKNCSGVALGGGPWQTLTENDEVEIMNGDMIGLVLEEAADEDETMVEGVFMFKAYPQEDKKSEGGGWFGAGGNRA